MEVAGLVFALGTTTTKLLCFQDDEVFVERLQGGVGEAGCAIEDSAAEEHHVEPLDEGAAGQLIEERLLVEAAGVEVGIA